MMADEFVTSFSYIDLSTAANTPTATVPRAAPDPPLVQEAILRIVFVLTGVVGTFGNSLVCIVIANALKKKPSTTNMLILNQATVDLCTSVMLIFIYTLDRSRVPEDGPLGELLCRFWYSNTLLWMLFVVSTYNLVMLCLERFIAVTFAFYYSTRFKPRSALYMIVFCWIFAPFIHLYYPLFFDYNDGGVCMQRYERRSAIVMGFVIILWEFFVPFVVMCVLYACVMVALRKQQRRVRGTTNPPNRPPEDVAKSEMATLAVPNPISTGRNSSLSPSACNNQVAVMSDPDASTNSSTIQTSSSALPGARGKRSTTSNRLRRNLTFTLLAVFVMFGLCWLPNHLTFFLFGLGKAQLGTLWHQFTLVLAYFNMSVNPFIYAWKYRQFQLGFKRIFCSRRNAVNAEIALQISLSSATNRAEQTRQRNYSHGLIASLPDVETRAEFVSEVPADDLLSNATKAHVPTVQS